MKQLGITREKHQLLELTSQADKMNIHIVPLPLTTISSLIDNENHIPDLSQYDWLFFTSAHGVHTFFENCHQPIPDSIQIASVGEKTSESIISYGLSVHFQPTEAYGKKLFLEFKEAHENEELKILFIRAEIVNVEPNEIFTHSTIKYNEMIAYRTVENFINEDEIKTLTNEDFILFTAPSSVQAYKNQFGTPIAKLIAIGKTTQQAIEDNNWKTYKVLDKPEIQSVLEYI